MIDACRLRGLACVEVQFGGRPTNGRFLNKRAEMYWAMRDWLQGGGALPKDTAYRVDLTATRYTHKNAAEKLQLESKEEVKTRLRLSPDLADALALTFASPVEPRARTMMDALRERLAMVADGVGASGRVARDHDPYEEKR